MIAQMDGTDWIIATASKCGSSRLRTGLTQEAKSRPKAPVAEFLNPWQGGRAEDVPEYDLRIQLAREPLERWNSLFWDFRNHREKPPIDGEDLSTFPKFMAAIVERKAGHYDCKPLTEHLEEWDPHFTLLLQDMDYLWELIDAPPLWREYYYGASRHKTKDKKSLDWTLQRFGRIGDAAQALVEREREMLREHDAWDTPEPEVAGPPQQSLL